MFCLVLQPRNIFLHGSDHQVKIGDFGLACKDLLWGDADQRFQTERINGKRRKFNGFQCLSFYGIKIIKLLLARVTTLAKSQLPFKGLTHTSGVGTCLYASPEQLQGSHYDFKVENFVLFLLFSINTIDNRNKSSLSLYFTIFLLLSFLMFLLKRGFQLCLLICY